MENFDQIEHVVWDGDNTIWDWMEYAVPAYEAMCHTIAGIAGKSFDETAAAMKAFYTAAGTLEDVRLIQGLQAAGFFSHLPNFPKDQAIRMVHSIFGKIRREKLHTYRGVSTVMKRIRERGIEQIMITDAPGGQASERLHSSRLGKNISRIYAMPTADLPDLPSGFRRHKSSIPLYDLKREKPHVDLEEIFEKTREKIGRTVVIVGDNESKDMELARRYGCIGVHARYGVARAELVERIRKFAPDRVARRSMQLEGDGGVGAANDRIYNVDDPLEILQLVG